MDTLTILMIATSSRTVIHFGHITLKPHGQKAIPHAKFATKSYERTFPYERTIHGHRKSLRNLAGARLCQARRYDRRIHRGRSKGFLQVLVGDTAAQRRAKGQCQDD